MKATSVLFIKMIIMTQWKSLLAKSIN